MRKLNNQQRHPQIQNQPKPSRKDKRFAYSQELIRISVLDADGNERQQCSRRMPRNRLTQEFLQEIINRSSAKDDPDGCLMEFIRDTTGVDVVWPSEMMRKCHTKPFPYFVVRKKLRVEGYDAMGDDTHYRYTGELRVMLKMVPIHTS